MILNAPKLRFPEFKESWKSSYAGDAFKSSRAKGKSGLPIYSVTMDRGLVRRDSMERYMASDAADGQNLRAQRGDIVYNMMRMWQGAVGIAHEECMVSPAYVVLSPKKHISPQFFDQWFKASRMLYLLWAYSQGITSDRLRLYADDFARIPLQVPCLQEQQKIAAFLGVIDDKLAAMASKLAALQKFKLGLMQKLFRQQLRFTQDSGRAFKDWDKRPLKQYLRERKEFEIKSDGLEHISLTVEGVVPKSERYDRDFLVNDDTIKKYKVTRLGDLCYNPANLKFGAIAINKLGDGIFSPIYVTFRVSGINVRFLEAYVTSWSFLRIVRRYEQGTVYERQAVHPDDFLRAIVPFPQPEEQQKIADALTAMDIKIVAVADQVAKLQTFKRGLLQQMFV